MLLGLASEGMSTVSVALRGFDDGRNPGVSSAIAVGGYPIVGW